MWLSSLAMVDSSQSWVLLSLPSLSFGLVAAVSTEYAAILFKIRTACITSISTINPSNYSYSEVLRTPTPREQAHMIGQAQMRGIIPSARNHAL